jgi:hypothetical protein
MKSYLLKVIWEGKEIVFRDLLVPEDKSLFELHESILKAFGLDSNQLAGFTKYDDSLQFETDYQLEAFDENSSLMTEHQVADVMEEVGDSLDYTYDFLQEIKFALEVIEVRESKEVIDSISLVKSYGELPAELGKDLDPEDAESILIKAMLDEAEFEDEEEDEDDIFGQGGYESLDDYEEFL